MVASEMDGREKWPLGGREGRGWAPRRRLAPTPTSPSSPFSLTKSAYSASTPVMANIVLPSARQPATPLAAKKRTAWCGDTADSARRPIPRPWTARLCTPSAAMTKNQAAATGEKRKATDDVPRCCTANKSARMPAASPTDGADPLAKMAGNGLARPSTAEMTEMEGVSVPSPRMAPTPTTTTTERKRCMRRDETRRCRQSGRGGGDAARSASGARRGDSARASARRCAAPPRSTDARRALPCSGPRDQLLNPAAAPASPLACGSAAAEALPWPPPPCRRRMEYRANVPPCPPSSARSTMRAYLMTRRRASSQKIMETAPRISSGDGGDSLCWKTVSSVYSGLVPMSP